MCAIVYLLIFVTLLLKVNGYSLIFSNFANLIKKIEEEILFHRFLTHLSSPFSIDHGMISRG